MESHPVDAKRNSLLFEALNGRIAHVSGYGAERHHGHKVVRTLASSRQS
jgi:hypothetical protein